MVASSPFVIRELGGDQRTVSLTGRAAPYRPFELSGEQSIEFEHLPGAPERTATVTGPVENATSATGFWKSKFLGDTSADPPFRLDNRPVLTAREAIKTMDSFRLLGQQLEVTWLDSLRRGFLKKFVQKWHNSEDVEWEMAFEWISRGEPTQPVVLVTDTGMGDAFANVSSIFDFLNSISVPPIPLASEILNGLQEITNGIGNLILDAEGAVQNFTDQITSPIRAVRGLISTLQSLQGEAELMTAFLEGQPASAFGSGPPDQQSYSEKQSLALYREELRAWALSLRQECVEQRTALSAQITTNLLATYVARDGEDLRDVARQFYGTPFEWRRLLVFNDLNTLQLFAGQLVLVPPLSVEQADQRAPGN